MKEISVHLWDMGLSSWILNCQWSHSTWFTAFSQSSPVLHLLFGLCGRQSLQEIALSRDSLSLLGSARDAAGRLSFLDASLISASILISHSIQNHRCSTSPHVFTSVPLISAETRSNKLGTMWIGSQMGGCRAFRALCESSYLPCDQSSKRNFSGTMRGVFYSWVHFLQWSYSSAHPICL